MFLLSKPNGFAPSGSRAKISLVIPTRERAEYLAFALRSARIAADNAGVPVEIVVSDNASDDATASVIAAFDDPRIVARRSDRRLSMRENFEFALSHASGSHILFIGDDDAVLPNGLRLLGDLIATHDVDIVKWRVLNYIWPDAVRGVPGHLKVRPQTLDGRIRLKDPKQVLADFAASRFRTYHEGGMIYHGCVSRRLIMRACAQGKGPFFRGSSPDVFTSLQALMVTDRPMVHINLSITLGGASPRSNGAAGQAAAKSVGSSGATEFARFIAETGDDPWQCRLPVHCKSLTMITLDCLLAAANLHGIQIGIDRNAWAKRIAQDIASFAEPARSECLGLAEAVFGLKVRLPEASVYPSMVAEPISSSDPDLAPDHTVLRRGLSKLVFSGGAFLSDAAAAAELLDQLLQIESARPDAICRSRGLWRVLRAHLRAGSFAA